jgi:hypothetical protein
LGLTLLNLWYVLSSGCVAETGLIAGGWVDPYCSCFCWTSA